MVTAVVMVTVMILMGTVMVSGACRAAASASSGLMLLIGGQRVGT